MVVKVEQVALAAGISRGPVQSAGVIPVLKVATLRPGRLFLRRSSPVPI
jgi:hypothetical protein